MRRWAIALWGGAAVSLPLEAQVQGGRGEVPRVVSEATLNPREGLNFAATRWPRSVYVGQQVTYEIGIFLGEDLRARLRSNPQFVPPDVPSVLTVDLPVPPGPLQRMEGGQTFEVHVFSRALFPLTAGTHRIAPARLTYALPLGNSFFSREETHAARSQPLQFVARETPIAGRPADYHGAVGQLSLRSWTDARQSRVGDPVQMTVAVNGVGNVSLFPRPTIRVEWGQSVPAGERVRLDSSAYLVRGTKEFDFVITPLRAGTLNLPEVRYPYFNPYTERYEVAVAPKLPLQITAAALAASGPRGADPMAEPPLSVRRSFRGELPLPVTDRVPFWLAAVLAPIPAVALGARRLRGRASSVPPGGPFVERLSRAVDPRSVRRAFGDALQARASISAVALGDPRRLERLLRRAGVSSDAASDVSRVARELNEAAFARDSAISDDVARRAAAAYARVDDEAKPLSATRPRRRWYLPALLLGTTSLLGAADLRESARSQFEAGVQAYDAGNVGEAVAHFSSSANLAPRAADAWANLGTAGWRAGDTAAAVIGWQRALRLEPLAVDVRSRLAATPGLRGGIVGEIPAVPVTAVAWLGLTCWIVAWGLAAHRNRATHRRLRWTVGVVAVATIAAALGARSRQEGARRVVVVRPERLQLVPAFGSDAGQALGSTTGVGETATQLSVEGGWTRVRFDDEREGWIESQRLQSLRIAMR